MDGLFDLTYQKILPLHKDIKPAKVSHDYLLVAIDCWDESRQCRLYHTFGVVSIQELVSGQIPCQKNIQRAGRPTTKARIPWQLNPRLVGPVSGTFRYDCTMHMVTAGRRMELAQCDGGSNAISGLAGPNHWNAYAILSRWIFSQGHADWIDTILAIDRLAQNAVVGTAPYVDQGRAEPWGQIWNHRKISKGLRDHKGPSIEVEYACRSAGRGRRRG